MLETRRQRTPGRIVASARFTTVINYAQLIQPDDGRLYFHVRAGLSVDQPIYTRGIRYPAPRELIGLRRWKSIHRLGGDEYRVQLIFATS